MSDFPFSVYLWLGEPHRHLANSWMQTTEHMITWMQLILAKETFKSKRSFINNENI